jgi:hypothetical protein
VAIVGTDVLEERSASIIKITWRRYVPPKRRFLQEPHGVTYQKTALFIFTAVKTSNLTDIWFFVIAALCDVMLAYDSD